MDQQLYYEDVKEGMEVPTLIKHPTTRQSAMWAGATGDFHEIHYDKDSAIKEGLPDKIVQGDLSAAFLGQLITNWMGDWGTFKRIRTTNRGILMVEDDVICKGKVSKKYVDKGECFVECEVWAENKKGEGCVFGTVLFTLPAREKS